MVLCCACQSTTQTKEQPSQDPIRVSVNTPPVAGLQVIHLNHQYDDVTGTYQITAMIQNHTKGPISLQMIVHYVDANGKERAQATGVTHHNIAVGDSAAFKSVWFLYGMDKLPSYAKVSFDKL